MPFRSQRAGMALYCAHGPTDHPFARTGGAAAGAAEHLQACAGRAVAAGDPRMKSSWVDRVAQLGKAMAATGSVIAELKWTPRGSSLSALGLRLPKLPRLPEAVEGSPPPPKICKTTPDRISSPINSLTDHRSKGSRVKSRGGAPARQPQRAKIRLPYRRLSRIPP